MGLERSQKTGYVGMSQTCALTRHEQSSQSSN